MQSVVNDDGRCPSARSAIWVNDTFFTIRNEIFHYIRPGEALVRKPFQRLIEERALLGYKYTGFW